MLLKAAGGKWGKLLFLFLRELSKLIIFKFELKARLDESEEEEEALKKEKPKSGLSAAEVVVSSWSYGADPNYPHCPKPSGHACQSDMPKSGGGIRPK